jgi:hypothetical protein
MNGREVRGGGREGPPPRTSQLRHHGQVCVLSGACTEMARHQRGYVVERMPVRAIRRGRPHPFAVQGAGLPVPPASAVRAGEGRARNSASPDRQDVLRSKRSLTGRISGPVAGTTARRRLTTPKGT